MMMMIRFDTPQQYTTTTHHSSFALCHTCLSLACGCLPFDVRHRFLFVLLSFSDDFFFRCNWPALSPIFFFFFCFLHCGGNMETGSEWKRKRKGRERECVCVCVHVCVHVCACVSVCLCVCVLCGSVAFEAAAVRIEGAVVCRHSVVAGWGRGRVAVQWWWSEHTQCMGRRGKDKREGRLGCTHAHTHARAHTHIHTHTHK